jgi:hypothetical protein
VSPIQKHMLKMFIALRWGVGVIGISLPIILGTVGYWVYGIPLPGSMSAYYHATKNCSGTEMTILQGSAENSTNEPASDQCLAIGTGPLRNWFVGNLFFIGGAMLLMRGFSRLENWALNIAGIMAPCVALFPMNWGDQHGCNPHQAFAVTFFVCIAITCVFCSEKTLKEMPATLPNRAQKIAFYRRWYRVLGALMIILPICADFSLKGHPSRTFFVEAGGVVAFGLYWIVKTFELKLSDIENRALKGELPHLDPHTLF